MGETDRETGDAALDATGEQPMANGPASPDAGADKAEQYFKNWQRTAADFANYKRRIELERSSTARFASEALVINLLPVFDDLDRAVSNVDDDLAAKAWVQGVVGIHRKFSNLLQAMGVDEVPAAGERFDPALHEAISDQPGEEGKVLIVAQKGYRLGEKVIRPAMVVVGAGTG